MGPIGPTPRRPASGRRRVVLALGAALIFAGAALLFWRLRPLRRPGGDTTELASWIVHDQWTYYYRAPATFFAHQIAYRLLRPLGWSAREAMGLNSALAGGLFVLALVMISRHPLFLLVNLGCGAALLFAGHQENYGYVNACLVLFMACGMRVWERRRQTDGAGERGRRGWEWAAGAAFALGCAAHLLTVFYLPALLALAFLVRREGGRWRRRSRQTSTAGDLAPFLAPFGAFLIAMMVATALMHRFAIVYGLDNNLTRIVPLGGVDDPRYFFTMFSVGHARFLAFLYAHSAPLALPLIAILIWRHGRDPFLQWLAVCAACGLAWTFLWHPDLLQGDWDLFANVAFPLNVLAGLLLARATRRTTSPPPRCPA